MGYLRTNYRLTGRYMDTEVIRDPGMGAVFTSVAASRLYVFMSGATWLAFSVVAAVSI